VLDPFMGAGTVAIAAERLGRDWLGIELSPAYAAQAEQRIAEERTRRATKEDAQAAA
jgi:DNA modification methylase